MSDMEELRIEARKKALAAAKAFGWPLGGQEYKNEMEDILDGLIRDKLKRENETKERGRL